MCGIQKTCEILKSGINVLLSDEKKICGIFVGIPGFSEYDNRGGIFNFLRTAYPDIKCAVNSDVLNIIYSDKNYSNGIYTVDTVRRNKWSTSDKNVRMAKNYYWCGASL